MAGRRDTFTLRIEFAGMCLFSRDAGSASTYVLLPKAPGHLARLFYNTAEDPNYDPTRDLCTSLTKACLRLDGLQLDLRNLVSGPPAGQPVSPDVIDLSAGPAGKTVRRRMIEEPVRAPIAARVCLNAGSLEDVEEGLEWRFREATRNMAISGWWTIPDVEGPLTIGLGTEDLVLHPRGDVLKVHIFNALEEEHPDADFDQCGELLDARHFAHFYPLLVNGAAETEVPHRDKPVSGDECTKSRGRLFTCIMAQAEAEA